MHKRLIFTILIISIFIFNFNSIYGSFGNITEKSSIILDSDGLSVLYNKNMSERIYPASTTKILTAILAIENLNLDSNITVSAEAVKNVPNGSSTMYLKVGEIVTVRELLYGLLLTSGSDAAVVLAEAVSGSTENFVILMNSKIKELGCTNSHFSNPHGYHEDNHYSTAYDMALLMKYASKNETFRKICETKDYVIEPTNKTAVARSLVSTNLMFSYNLDYTLGGKTGYTEEAGNVFICYSKLDGKNIICGVFDGSKNILNKSTRFKDVKMLLDNAYENYDKTKILDKNTFKISYVDKNTKKNYILGIDKDIYCLTDGNSYIVDYKLFDVAMSNNIITGKLTVTAKNENWKFDKTYDLKVIETQKYIDDSKSDNSNLIYLLSLAILTTLLIVLLRIKYINKKKRKKVNKKYTTKRRTSN